MILKLSSLHVTEHPLNLLSTFSWNSYIYGSDGNQLERPILPAAYFGHLVSVGYHEVDIGDWK